MKQGEIWQINLDPAIGAEMKKIRPALIINVDALGKLPLKVIAPVTDWKDHYLDYPWMVKIEPTEQNGLSKTSAADCFQIRGVSADRFAALLDSAAPEIIAQAQPSCCQSDWDNISRNSFLSSLPPF